MTIYCELIWRDGINQTGPMNEGLNKLIKSKQICFILRCLTLLEKHAYWSSDSIMILKRIPTSWTSSGHINWWATGTIGDPSEQNTQKNVSYNDGTSPR